MSTGDAAKGAMSVVGEAITQMPNEAESLYASAAQAIANGSASVAGIRRIGQLALASLQDPRIYPELVNLADTGVFNGLPPQPVPELLGLLVAVGQRVGKEAQQAAGPQRQDLPEMRDGGALPHKLPGGTQDMRLHEGEYVMSPAAVRFLGTDKLDKLNEAHMRAMQQKGSGGSA